MAGFDYAQVTKLATDLSHAPAKVLAKATVLMTTTAAQVESAAVARVPVGATGNLLASIGTTVNGPFSRTVSADEYYGAFLEYGTSRMAPQPFMSPAADAIEDTFYTAMQALIDSTLD